MKWLLFVSLAGGPALAWDARSSFLPDFGVCSTTTSLFGSILGNSVCPHDTVALEVSSEDQDHTIASRWSYSTPCARNRTNEFCVFTNTHFANGRGITIFTSPERAARIAKTAAFTDPSVLGSIQDLNSDESPRWKVEEVPGKGMGLIATRRMEIGDHIMSTTPSTMIDYKVYNSLPAPQIRRMQVDGVSYLPDKHRAKFLNLTTHDFAGDHETTINKIISINSFDVEEPGFLNGNGGEEDSWYTVFPEISRINHDCRPNADYYFDPYTLAQHIHAVRPIEIGEEITISYIDPILPRAERRQKIDTSWHFPCSCSLCTQNSHQADASDARIQQINEVREQLRDYTSKSPATPALGELMVSLYEQERLWNSIYEAYTYAAIEYNGAGEPWLATKYARLAVQYGLPAVGPHDRDVEEMKALARDPWGHWSWMLRTKKRMNWGSNLNA